MTLKGAQMTDIYKGQVWLCWVHAIAPIHATVVIVERDECDKCRENVNVQSQRDQRDDDG